MKKEYAVIVYQIETSDGTQWCAEFPDLKGCVGGGDTAEEAVTEAYDNLKFHLEGLKEMGINIPDPEYKYGDDYSGKLMVRMSKNLHKKLADCAKEQNVSQNALIVEAIAEKVGSLFVTSKIEISMKNALSIIKDSFQPVRHYSSQIYQQNNRYYVSNNGITEA